MPAAARVGDLTSHGSPLGPGRPGPRTVLIGGMPAWCAVADFHACPLANGLQPHVGGVVAKGSESVMIEGCLAAREGDSVMEAGGPNTIKTGCLTVMIG